MNIINLILKPLCLSSLCYAGSVMAMQHEHMSSDQHDMSHMDMNMDMQSHSDTQKTQQQAVTISASHDTSKKSHAEEMQHQPNRHETNHVSETQVLTQADALPLKPAQAHQHGMSSMSQDMSQHRSMQHEGLMESSIQAPSTSALESVQENLSSAHEQVMPDVKMHEHSEHAENVAIQHSSMHDLAPDAQHKKEHGGQIFQASKLESKWVKADQGDDHFKTEFESRIGTDENKIYVQIHADKTSSADTSSDAKLLYSRNIANYWDVQTGVRYRYTPEHDQDQNRFDAVIGLQGLAQYFFETELYAFIGADDEYSLSLETEKDFLFTQKFILKPFFNAVMVVSDHSKYAQKSGLNSYELGLEARYEVTKKFMPFLELSYDYEKGNRQTTWQQSTASEYEWNYAAGIRFRF